MHINHYNLDALLKSDHKYIMLIGSKGGPQIMVLPLETVTVHMQIKLARELSKLIGLHHIL